MSRKTPSTWYHFAMEKNKPWPGDPLKKQVIGKSYISEQSLLSNFLFHHKIRCGFLWYKYNPRYGFQLFCAYLMCSIKKSKPQPSFIFTLLSLKVIREIEMIFTHFFIFCNIYVRWFFLNSSDSILKVWHLTMVNWATMTQCTMFLYTHITTLR